MLEKFMGMDLKWVFRMLVVPVMFLGAMVRRPALQLAVMGVAAVWTGAVIVQAVCRKSRERQKKPKETIRERVEGSETGEELSDAELFVIRQINHRVTEQLKRVYPSVTWVWIRRPDLQDMRNGGSWRIRMDNAEPYNAGDVRLTANGTMEITLLLATPLERVGEKAGAADEKEPEDLKPEEKLDRTDAHSWYTQYGADLLAGMIDEFNTQGHKSLTIDEEGTVYLKSGGKDLAVDRLEWFLPRLAWPEFRSLLKEDGIKATEVKDGLVLNW